MQSLLVGSTGMLGQALMKEMKSRGFEVIGVARSGADISCDIVDEGELSNIISSIKPQLIINSAAIVNLAKCEEKPDCAYLVNARSASIMAEISRKTGIYFIQISTDHYYTGDFNLKHTEEHPIQLINEYARTKYAAECFALAYQKSLVIRTNIVGFRNTIEAQTFLEWVIQNLKNQSPMTIFDDYFTSSIHVKQFSSALLDIIEKRSYGLLNLASRDVFSKKSFICALAHKMGYSLDNVKVGSVFDTGAVSRAESLGLDVGKAEKILGYELPTLNKVIASITEEYEGGFRNDV
ncbi:SDR family oxidoreductase [uncultured Methanomethylovorans sp.]|uniref:SDR family oxidoreductase n=1 Tax=uncultured Methanomethylovorans sp. TaxID=183759 RepID=UPI002AA73156|nr:SDR family oxidoreductase [uncultured Methanomethylovorans sp.]